MADQHSCHVLHDQERGHKVKETFGSVDVREQVPEHLHESFFPIVLVNKWLLLLDDSEAFFERLLPIVLRHIGRELSDVTGGDIDHLVCLGMLLGVCGDLELV